ncbi:hypothetical protein A0H81_09598 [Grifola frondosa]|uniref:Uncharacterized protein n=1 Tax=Grifola frondosa TaxID=5627 RepID=A0A1C7M5I0_GRIFR|nr:hypothetical protein A0H81_09598 [Grifola frondosa]
MTSAIKATPTPPVTPPIIAPTGGVATAIVDVVEGEAIEETEPKLHHTEIWTNELRRERER